MLVEQNERNITNYFTYLYLGIMENYVGSIPNPAKASQHQIGTSLQTYKDLQVIEFQYFLVNPLHFRNIIKQNLLI